MTNPLAQQKALLNEKIRILQRLDSQLQWSLDHLPSIDGNNLHDPAIGERIAAIVDRFCKLQDQLAGALRHAHNLLGEKQRSFQDVVTWAIAQQLLPSHDAWLELRSLRNRLTHEYDLETDRMPELLELIREGKTTLGAAIERFVALCEQLGLRIA